MPCFIQSVWFTGHDPPFHLTPLMSTSPQDFFSSILFLLLHIYASQPLPPPHPLSPSPPLLSTTPSSPSPSQTVSALVSRLPSRQASVSATAFERVLAVCAESLQLRLAYQTFTSMTLVHGLAPTRRGLQGVGRLLCAPALAANRQWRQLRLAFAYRMLEC